MFISNLLLTYYWFERHMDYTWGFMLMNGHKYTAPVWVSEFGASVRSDFWMKTLRYLSSRDVDWAYWPLNPVKLKNKEMINLKWVTYDPPLKLDDSWGLLAPDFMKIRRPWQLNDLQAIMPSPALQPPHTYPCDRNFVSKECGG